MPVSTSGETSAASDPLVNPVRLAGYLARTGLEERLPILSVERIGRGQSNLTFSVRLAGGDTILRRPPAGPLPPSAHDVLREYRVMRALEGSVVPVPRLLAACESADVLGAPFFLMERLNGDAIRFELPDALAASADAPRLIAEQLVDTLAALHQLNPSAVGLADLGKPSGYLARQLRRWKGQLEYARTRPVPDLDWAAAWLERHLPPDVERPSIVHGDYKLDNVIFSLEPPPVLLGVVDWEMATLGDPLADLGWLLAFWCQGGEPPRELVVLPRVTELPGFPSRQALVERYATQTGCDVPDLRFYTVFALWKMAVVLEGHWARHVRGTAGSFDFAYLETAGPIFARYIRHTAGGWDE